MNGIRLAGYKRAGGGFGVRNYIIILSMVHCANTVAKQIACLTGTAAITHEKGCVEAAGSHAATCLALTRAGQNPNVYGALLVGLGCEQTDHAYIAKELEAGGKKTAYISIQDCGGPAAAVEKGADLVRELLGLASEQKREAMAISDLTVGVQCGGSDWTTALSGNTTIGVMSDHMVKNGGSILISEVHGFPGSEHILAKNAVNAAVGSEIFKLTTELRNEYKNKTGLAIEDVNPTPGNKQGGITTLVEKSMGNVKKAGHTPIQGIVRLGERPPRPGVWILDNRCEGPDSINITGFAMSGAHIVAFSTGRGTPVGNAVMPIVKITGNSGRYELMRGMFDFDAGSVLDGADLETVGYNFFRTVIDIANGTLSMSETNGNREYSIPY